MNEENKLTFTLNDPNGGLTEFSKPSHDTVITFEEVFDISWLFFDLLKIFRTLMFCCSKKVNLPKNKKSWWNVYHLVNCQGSGARPWGCNVLKPGAGSNQVPFPRPLVERCAARPSYPGRSTIRGDLPFCFWPKPVQLLVSSFLDFLSYHKLEKRIYRVCLLWDGVTPEQ